LDGVTIQERRATAVAPLPPYMRRAMAAAGWRVVGEARFWRRGLCERAAVAASDTQSDAAA
jgi:hypothetical protein